MSDSFSLSLEQSTFDKLKLVGHQFRTGLDPGQEFRYGGS